MVSHNLNVMRQMCQNTFSPQHDFRTVQRDCKSPSTIYKFIKELLSELSLTEKNYFDLQNTNKGTSRIAHVYRGKLCIEIFRLAFKNKNVDMLQNQWHIKRKLAIP